MTAQIAPKKTTVPTETKRDTVRLLRKWFLGVGSGEDSTWCVVLTGYTCGNEDPTGYVALSGSIVGMQV